MRISAPLPPDADLSMNVPGQAAQARADELREQSLFRTFAARLFRIRTEATGFALEAHGERVVGRKLDLWSDFEGWHVLHTVPAGTNGADIDHVLIGPFGVVTVNTKCARARVWAADRMVMINGQRTDHLTNARYERDRAAELLSAAYGGKVPVTAALVFVGAKTFTLKHGGPPDIGVLHDVRALHPWLHSRPILLTPDQVTRIYAVARRQSTWKPRSA